jgi:hypothetical protein
MRCRALTIFLLFGLGSLTVIPSIQSGDARSPASQGASPRMVIDLRGGLLSVSVRNIPWEAVLKQIERQTGIIIDVKGALSGTLTQEFQGLPLEKGLRRLFRDANVLFFYAKETKDHAAPEALVRVLLLPKQGGVLGEKQVPQSPSESLASKGRMKPEDVAKAPDEVRQENEVESEDQVSAKEEGTEERLESLDIMGKEDNMEALQKAILDPDEAIRTRALELLAERDKQGVTGVLVGLTKSEEPEMRLKALSLLQENGQGDENVLLSTLGAALSDEDAGIKAYAIEVLADRGGSEAMDYLHQALRDPNPSVREMVLENAVQQDTGLPLLQEALQDEDEAVRSLATFLLTRRAPEGR